jgi:hypothetical protein
MPPESSAGSRIAASDKATTPSDSVTRRSMAASRPRRLRPRRDVVRIIESKSAAN